MEAPLSAVDLRHFHDHGFVRLASAFDPTAALRMRDYMWEYIAKHHAIHRDDRTTWNPAIDLKLNKTTHHRAYNAIGSPRLYAAVDQLLGAGTWNPPKGWGGFLVTFPPPNPPPWTVTYTNWHWDGDCWENLEQSNGLFIFTFFSSVQPKGGGTLVAGGTHRLLARFLKSLPDARKYTHSKLRPRFLASHPWLTALSHQSRVGEDRVARFMGWAIDIDGIAARVVELVGEPGDAVICHPSILHAESMNCTDVPRFMRVATIKRCDPAAGTAASNP
ncbi:MAG TPA: phytanoyl-CoA dioxygenase family protein [Tepidisphaeraceae bacterium]|jgi:hypothetical protein|nr:phytanoyl-CoA dioxygenase family protein [Tepidisphaeraceae bacterium]